MVKEDLPIRDGVLEVLSIEDGSNGGSGAANKLLSSYTRSLADTTTSLLRRLLNLTTATWTLEDILGLAGRVTVVGIDLGVCSLVLLGQLLVLALDGRRLVLPLSRDKLGYKKLVST